MQAVPLHNPDSVGQVELDALHRLLLGSCGETSLPNLFSAGGVIAVSGSKVLPETDLSRGLFTLGGCRSVEDVFHPALAGEAVAKAKFARFGVFGDDEECLDHGGGATLDIGRDGDVVHADDYGGP